MRSIRDQRIGFILRCFVLPALFVAPTIYMLIFLWSGSQGLPFPQRAKSVPFSAGHILGGFLRAVSQNGGAPNSKLGVEEWRFSSIFITTNDRRLLICHGSHWQTIFLYHFPVLIKIHALFFFFFQIYFHFALHYWLWQWMLMKKDIIAKMRKNSLFYTFSVHSSKFESYF